MAYNEVIGFKWVWKSLLEWYSGYTEFILARLPCHNRFQVAQRCCYRKPYKSTNTYMLYNNNVMENIPCSNTVYTLYTYRLTDGF